MTPTRAVEPTQQPAGRTAIGSRRMLVAVAALLIVAGAAAVRLADLGSQPGGLYPDEAAEGVTASRILHDPGYHPLFIAEDAGREPLFAYVVAGAFAVFGESTVTLRTVSAVIGILGVLAIGMALRRFGAGVALTAMAWAAGSLWLICVGRDGMRNILVPLAGAIALAALLRWSDHPGRLSAVLAGAAIGAGLWTYQPLKLLPLLALVWLWLLRRRNRGAYRNLVADVRWCIGAFVVVGGPMMFAALTQPGNYFGRGAETSAFNGGNSQDGVVTHIIRTLGQFTFVGDPNQRHDVNGMSLLGWPLFLLAVVGVVVAWRRRDQAAYLLLLLGLAVFFLPPLVATEGSAPHFLRNLGLAPFVGAFVGLGAVGTVRWLSRHGSKRLELVGGVVLAVALVVIGAGSAHAYFSRPVRDRYVAYSFAVVALAKAANHGPRTAVVVDSYSAFDVEFLDAKNPPTRFDPNTRIPVPGQYRQIVAPSRADLVHAVGSALADRAVVASVDPNGKPVVLTVTP
jgi:Dolichyl-phosphate-mannose-protein mannosyltransferase